MRLTTVTVRASTVVAQVTSRPAYPPSAHARRDRGKPFPQQRHQAVPGVAVLDTGGGDQHGQQPAVAVHRDVPFAALILSCQNDHCSDQW